MITRINIQVMVAIRYAFLISMFSAVVFVSDASAQTAVPQLQAGVYINDTIDFRAYQFAGYCDSLGAPDLTLLLGTGLAPFVTGVDLNFVVTACPSPPDTAFCLQTGVVAIGDIFSFPTSSTAYTFTSTPYAGGMEFAIILTGTPSVPFEIYPCSLLTLITLADCNNSMITMDAGIPCSVTDFVGMNEPDFKNRFSVSPNPVSHQFEISSGEMVSEFLNLEMFNETGQKIYEEKMLPGFLTKTVNTTNFPDGIYFLKVSNQHEFIYSGKVVIKKTD